MPKKAQGRRGIAEPLVVPGCYLSGDDGSGGSNSAVSCCLSLLAKPSPANTQEMHTALFGVLEARRVEEGTLVRGVALSCLVVLRFDAWRCWHHGLSDGQVRMLLFCKYG